MKKVLSISLSLLMIIGIVHFSVANHYCDELGSTSKVSFTGKPASCGMEETEDSCPVNGINLTSHCCDDVVVFYGINTNFTPSFSFVPELYQHNFQVFNTPNELPVVNSAALTSFNTNVYPPGVLLSTNVDLTDICVFRI